MRRNNLRAAFFGCSSMRSVGVLCGLAAMTASMGPAYAQDEETGLDTIIVTAQKKEESLQKTPLAVSVLEGDFMDANRIINFGDVGARVPGFSLSQPIKTQTTIALRGAGSVEDSAGADQAVGVFIDDVYMGNPSTFDFDLFDLERVEVLRGPQGTIFGKNVVGGALNFITRNPGEETVVKAELTYGRFNRFDARGSVSGPLVEDKLFGLFSFSSRNSDGYTKNIYTGNRLDADDQMSGRTKLRWTPTENFEALIGADYSRDKSYGISRVYRGPTPPTVGTIATDVTRVNHNLDGGYDRTMWGTNAKLTYSLDQGEIVSVTSYRDSTHNTATDADGTPFSAVEFVDIAADVKQFTQELRLANTAGRLSYIVGAYYFFSDYSRIETLSVQGAPGSYLDSITGGMAFPEILGQRIKTKSYAGFAQGTYSLTDRLRLTAGARYTWEKKYGNTVCILPGVQCGEVYDVPVEQHWSAVTPKFTVDTDLTENMFAYATVSRGFKSGGFASGFEDPASAAVPFNPEFAWNYELGLKTRWFDNRLQLNVAGYYVDYKDLQVRFFGGDGRTIVGNSGASKNKGVEVELDAAPVKGLEFWANYAFQKGKYDQLVLEGEDYGGNVTIFTPKHSISFGGSYTADLPNDAHLRFMGDLTHKSISYTTPSNDPERGIKYDALLNASVTYIFPSEQWEIQMWGKNLTNEHIAVGSSDYGLFLIPAADFLNGAPSYQSHYAPPITWGVTLRFNL